MSRTTTLLVALGAVITLVAWYLLLWSPRVDALELVEVDLQATLSEQAATQSRIGQLQQVREEAPDLQADLAAAAAVLPDETQLPSALRQLQQATDESGATLLSVAPGRPEAVEGATPGLYAVGLALELRGSYFQIVDTLRRLEDPTISPRGFLWDSVALGVGEEYPTLTVSLSGRMFSALETPPGEPAAGATPEAGVTPEAGATPEAGTTPEATPDAGTGDVTAETDAAQTDAPQTDAAEPVDGGATPPARDDTDQ